MLDETALDYSLLFDATVFRFCAVAHRTMDISVQCSPYCRGVPDGQSSDTPYLVAIRPPER